MRAEKSGGGRLIRIARASSPELSLLRYLVVERNRLVAAFSSRTDGELWIEQCGHPAMKLQEVKTAGTAKPSRSGQIHKKPARFPQLGAPSAEAKRRRTLESVRRHRRDN